ncbi:potassium channel family protein [Streptomyces sp. NPDC017958]|uniref:potassium channel family protein n=1 Tax=Streptomyces sp. NPDC017958 TaxID=3365021 RepID=UPI0037B87102
MEWLVTLVGAAVVLIILRDVFHTLWHPTRHGGLSRVVMSLLWRLSTRGRESSRTAGLAGPVGMVTVVATWACAVAVGWALVYWPHMPEAFSYSPTLKASEHSGPVDALYLSLVTVATLGLGDIAPSADWLRIVAPLEALVGFALLTATVSWILGIYPALARRRALALRISQLRRADPTAGQPASDVGAAVLGQLAADIARTCVDFLQYPESYYFTTDPATSRWPSPSATSPTSPSGRGEQSARTPGAPPPCSPPHSMTSQLCSTSASCTPGAHGSRSWPPTPATTEAPERAWDDESPLG